uniref:Uncharacterized protein n=1 Tax=Oryza rufipogon TaxID=4529 RepID=A0A0E0RGE4_ORYRU
MSSAAFPPTTFFQGSWGSEIESNHFFIAGEGGAVEAIHMLQHIRRPSICWEPQRRLWWERTPHIRSSTLPVASGGVLMAGTSHCLSAISLQLKRYDIGRHYW